MKKGIYGRLIKRPVDFTLSLAALTVLSPVLVIVAALIKLESEGPVFFIQERPGKNLEMFKIYKFRTMVKDAVKYQTVEDEVTNTDSRITAVGKFLRRSKIDELAQLINILKGDMAIVGPRPSLTEFLDLYEEWELRRFEVRPGLTGLAQVNGNIYLERKEKSAYDVKYVDSVSFSKDMGIILKTFRIVFFGEDKFVNKAGTELGDRGGSVK
jgi:lipopolysaccharide/colanic/teichoic acid biosynthesis glycosyltransferase